MDPLDSKIQSDYSIGVKGNCGMCKATIEKAVIELDFVKDAEWGIKSKILDVKFKNNYDTQMFYEYHIIKSNLNEKEGLYLANLDRLMETRGSDGPITRELRDEMIDARNKLDLFVKSSSNLNVLFSLEDAINESGYETMNSTANQSAYDALPMCCKYDRDMQVYVSKSD